MKCNSCKHSTKACEIMKEAKWLGGDVLGCVHYKKRRIWLFKFIFQYVNMKKLIILLFLFAVAGLSAVTFDLSLSIRTPKIDSLAIDYEIALRSQKDSLYSAEIEIERDTGEYYRNLELFGWQYYKFLQLSGKYINIQEDDLQVASVDIRVKHGTHSAGIANVWDMHPEINFVFGENIHWEFGIPYLMPIEFRSTSNFFTKDFKYFNNETEIQFNGAVSSIIDLYLRFKSRYYDDFNFSTKIGIGVKL